MTADIESRRRLHLGFIVDHDHANGVTDAPGARPQDRVIHLVQRAEREKLDFAFVADFLAFDETDTKREPCRFEPISLMAVLAQLTSHIGLVGTVSTTYTEPFNGARQLAGLDLLSGGRIGWNIVTSGNDTASKNYGSNAAMRHDDRYTRGSEYVEVVKGLWASFDDDAFTTAEPGHSFNPSKLHILNHEGRHFSVRGPLPAPRSPQGQPILISATGSSTGLDFAAKYAEMVVTTPIPFAPPEYKRKSAVEFYRRFKELVVAHGRRPEDVIVSQMISPVFGSSFADLMKSVDHDSGLKYMHTIYDEGVDFYKYDLDAPFPDVGRQNGFQSVCDSLLAVSREMNWTLRDVAKCIGMGTNSMFGSAEEIADQMQAMFREEATDGFILFSGYGGAGKRRNRDGHIRFMDEVVPILRSRGFYHADYRSTTLRGNLGLPPAPAFVRMGTQQAQTPVPQVSSSV